MASSQWRLSVKLKVAVRILHILKLWSTENRCPMNTSSGDTGLTPGSGWYNFFVGFGVILGFLLLFIVIALFVGYTTSLKTPCPAGYRAISVDGSKSRIPKSETDIIVPDLDYPTCSPMMSCPTVGQQWAVAPDGSALTNSCLEPGCPCSAFQHCPSYSSTVFRQFGADSRVSLFQVVDPLVKDPNPPPDPYDVPYVLKPGQRDFCFLTPSTIATVWPMIHLGDKCLRGTLGKVKTSPSLFVCAPTQYVSGTGPDATFQIDDYQHALAA